MSVGLHNKEIRDKNIEKTWKFKEKGASLKTTTKTPKENKDYRLILIGSKISLANNRIKLNRVKKELR